MARAGAVAAARTPRVHGPARWPGIRLPHGALPRPPPHRAGFVDAVVRFFDFLHPATPAPLLDAVSRLGSLLEGLPAVRALAGSLLVRATRG